MTLDPSLLLLVGFLAGAGFVLLLRFLWSRIPRSPARWDSRPPQPSARAALATAGTALAPTPTASPAPGRTAPVATSSLASIPDPIPAPTPSAGGVGSSSASLPSSPSGAIAVRDSTVAEGPSRLRIPSRDLRAADGGTGIARGSEVRSPTIAEPTLRLSQRVVLHLQRQPRITRFDLAPPAMTQAGMAEQLRATQSALAKVLARLAAAGVLEERREHVQGQPRRLKVYQLTPTGEALARDLRRRAPAPTAFPERGTPGRREFSSR
ncbi:MAG: hypothetical protein L3K19_08190 [Thermoplasmata archaeon]|nr:hypothetical protein [Thermoplasmata archaeon]